jgi:hypothetical protein
MSAAHIRLEGIDRTAIATRLINLIFASVFFVSFVLTYVNDLSPLWSYMGFTYARPDSGVFVFGTIAALLPSLLLPLSVKQVGDFIRWVVYFGLYIPATILPVIMGNLSASDSLKLVVSLLTAFLIICIRFPASAEKDRKPLIAIDRRLFWTLFFAAYAALTFWVVATYGSRLQLVDLMRVYGQRTISNEVLEGSLVGYAAGFLSGAFNPFLVAVGLTKKRYWMSVIGSMGQMLIFSAAAGKLVAISIILIPGFYFTVFRKEPFRISRVGLVFAGTALGLALVAADIYSGRDIILQFAFSLVYMRTFAMSGCLTGVYAEFFLTHPVTHYSHISVMRMYFDYPYAATLGEVIGEYLSPIGVAPDANTNFFATDGMAALGFWGVAISGVLFRLFIAIFDNSTNRENVAVLCCAIVPVLASAMNLSMFTTLLSGGGIVLALISYFYSRSIQELPRLPA